MLGEIGGAQAQVMSAAELQIAVRVECTVNDVRRALWTDRTLVKTWLMRGTLHLVPAADLPVYTGAMAALWRSQMRRSWLEFMQTTESEFWRIVDEIGAALDGKPMTREELIDRVGKGRSEHVRTLLKSGWGGMLKPAARSGLLCFGPNRGQSVTFVKPQEWIGSWRSIGHETALREVVTRYIRAYGPATKRDFARWWGAWPGVANAAWSALGDRLVRVSVEGARLDMLASDLDAIRQAAIEEPVQLLPAFDPYILGHAARDHLYPRAFASKVSRVAGWISAVVLHDGVVVGTWTHSLKNGSLQLTVTPFRRPPPGVTAAIRLRAATLGGALGVEKVKVSFA